jgi:uncharacterized membrane protein YdcZ (DUF606 family)
MQAPVNSRLGKSVGSLQAATLSFLVGTVALLLIAAFVRGGLGSFGQVRNVPWWAARAARRRGGAGRAAVTARVTLNPWSTYD